jgi:nucleoside-diphosphate-sugar epimerase
MKKNFEDRLSLYEADLLKEHSFDEAIHQCDYVMHVASPAAENAKDAWREIIDPAIKGTKNVLESCRKAGTVKKVILTSSVTAICNASVVNSDSAHTGRSSHHLIGMNYPRKRLERQPRSIQRSLFVCKIDGREGSN